MSRAAAKVKIKQMITDLLAMVDPIDGQRHEAYNILYDLLHECGSEEFVDEVLADICASDFIDEESLTGHPY